MPFSKQSQLKKNKRVNPRKMTKIGKELYQNFIYDNQGGMCFCGCGRPIDEYHHSIRGVYKDDRSLVGISRHCHSLIHNCQYKNIDETSRLTLLAKAKGKQNWSDYIL